MTRSKDDPEILRPLAATPFQAYISDSLQIFDILDWVLHQTGPAEVRQTTFSISEEHLRRIARLRELGIIRSLSLVLDHKATNKTLNLWSFIANASDRSFLANNHSKVLLVRSASMKVSVVTSQNLTRGNRFEASFISSDPEIFDRLSDDFDSIISTAIPLDEVLRTATQID